MKVTFYLYRKYEEDDSHDEQNYRYLDEIARFIFRHINYGISVICQFIFYFFVGTYSKESLFEGEGLF